MANIKDVAKAAGVSVSTVSNILNGKVFVSEELHQKVSTAMQELGYHPNFLAMNLRKRKIGFIGVVVSSMCGHYHQILEGIYRVAKDNKCQPIVKVVDNASDEHCEIESLLQLNVSGIIVISYNLNEELIEHYRSTGLPIVFADLYPKQSEYSIVRFDNYKIVRSVTEELQQQGKRVGLVTGSCFFGSEEDCIKGYRDALKQTGQTQHWMLETDFIKEHAFQALMQYMSSLKELPDFFITSTSHLAQTILEVFSILGVKNVFVIALSGDSWYRYQEKRVTYIARDAIFCGIKALKILLENIKLAAAFDTQYITLEVRRDSTIITDHSFKSQDRVKQQKTLKLLLLKSNISICNVIEQLSCDFTNKTGIQVSITSVSRENLIDVIIDNAKKQSCEYDIIMTDMHWLQQLKQERVFCRLNDLLSVEKILPRYVRDVRNYIMSDIVDENVYALPIVSGHQMLAYRRDLFEDALVQKKFYIQCGVPLTLPHNWNEFNLIAKFFTKEFNKESPIEFGTCLLGRKLQAIMAEFLPRQRSYGGRFLGDIGLEINSMENLKAVKNLCESYRYSYPDCEHYLEDEQVREFLKGNIAMISTYNVHIENVLDDATHSVHFAPMPGNVALVGGWLLGINAYSKQKEESALFLEWEMSENISVYSSLLGQVSPFKSVFFDDELSVIYPWMNIIKEQYTPMFGKEFGTLNVDGNSLGFQLEVAFADQLWRAICGEIDPVDVLEQLQERFEKAFRG